MNNKLSPFVLALSLALGIGSLPLVAQASNNDRYGDRYDDRSSRYDDERSSRCDSCGTVRSVQRISQRASNGVGAGTVVGALVGGAIGNQVGKGNGRKAATVVGAIAGGAVGHDIEKDRRRGRDAYRISVRMDSGQVASFTQSSANGLRSGDRVVVENGYVERLN